MNVSSAPNKSTPLILNLIAFLMAFCSFSYEILIATRLSRIFAHGMFVYPTCIAVFILFMGLGSTRWLRKKDTDQRPLLIKLFWIECGLTVLGFLSILSIDLSLFDSLYSINPEAIVVGLLMAAAIGFFSGQELPIIFQICAELQLGQKQIRRIIFFDYLASFAASVSCTLLLFSTLGLLKTSVCVSMINLIVMACVFLLFAKLKPSHVQSKANLKFLRLAGVLILSFLTFYTLTVIYIDRGENHILKRIYHGKRPARLLSKHHTPYQQVLLFTIRKDNQPITMSKNEILAHPEQFFLYTIINGTLQFFEPFEVKADQDHTFLFDPYIQLVKDIEHVLILGGGDGLPARQAVKYDSIKTITMVDIDKQWVNLSKNNAFLSKKNNRSLEDPRVNVYTDDAFKWVLKTKKKFDLIIVDFPSEPSTLAKRRTLSVQFWRDLYRITNKNGIIILYESTRSSQTKLRIHSRTASEAGFVTLFGYKEDNPTWGSVEQIVLFRSPQQKQQFMQDYPSIYLKDKKNTSVLKEFGQLDFYEVEEGRHVLSFYDPLVSKLPFKKQMRLITGRW